MCIIIYDVICINLGVIHIQHSCSDLRPSHGKTRFQALCAGFVHSSWQVFLGFGWNTSNDATQIQASKQDCKVSRASYLGSIFGTDCHCRRDIIERPRKPIFGCKWQKPGFCNALNSVCSRRPNTEPNRLRWKQDKHTANQTTTVDRRLHFYRTDCFAVLQSGSLGMWMKHAKCHAGLEKCLTRMSTFMRTGFCPHGSQASLVALRWKVRLDLRFPGCIASFETVKIWLTDIRSTVMSYCELRTWFFVRPLPFASKSEQAALAWNS